LAWKNLLGIMMRATGTRFQVRREALETPQLGRRVPRMMQDDRTRVSQVSSLT
jgi:hypothetical protein